MERYPDLPVCVDLTGRLAEEVTAFVEAEAGWQVVGGEGPLLPVLTLAAEAAGPGSVVVRPGAVTSGEVREALLAGALDVVSWPEDRLRLLSLPGRLRPASAGPAAPLLRVGGCRGGVGASTVALAIGATVAWSGGRALVVGDAGLVRLGGIGSWQGPGAAELSVLGAAAAHEVERVARPLPGIRGLCVLLGSAQLPVPAGWPYDLVVADVGVAGAAEAHLVVAAADGSLAHAPPGADVLVVEHGPLDRAGVRRALGRSPAGWLPYSARVARAGLAGRVPSALPGSWVKALRAGVGAMAEREPLGGTCAPAGSHPDGASAPTSRASGPRR